MRGRLSLLWVLCLGLLASSVGLTIVDAQAPDAVQNTLTDCPFGIPAGETVGETALCGELTVPENWQEPDGRKIVLRYIVLKAQSSSPFGDPVIYLEGGPGASALINVPFLAEIFEEIRRYRDVIIYDQRGTAFSTPLFCPGDIEGAPLPADLELADLPTSDDDEIQALLESARTVSGFSTAVNCRPYFEGQGFDLSQYSTASSVRDLVAMMTAFDYEAYNIYGISYGTNLALELFRYYEENEDLALPALRSGIIDGVVPPSVDTRGGQAYISGYNVLRVFEDCEADATCAAAFPNIRQRAVDLLLQVDETPLNAGNETIDAEQLRRVLVDGLNYRQDATGGAIGIGAQYYPLLVQELEQGIPTTFVGLRDGELPLPLEPTENASADNPFGNIASEATTLADRARELASGIEQLQLESERASDALSSGVSLPEFFIQEFRIGVTQLDFLTATFLPVQFDYLLAGERTRDNLAVFASSLNPETGALVSLMSDADVAETYLQLEQIRPSIQNANMITLDVIGCNDRYGSFDLEALFEGYRSFEVPGLVNKTDVAVNAKVVCTAWGLTPDGTGLTPPVVSDLPIMVTNGSVDSETPVEWGEAAYEALTNAYFVTFAYAPHGASTQFSCGPAVAAAFILDPGRMPDTSCADDLQKDIFPFVLPESD